MDRFDDDILFAELRALRPTPRPEFTADLDDRAAAGFPRRDPRAATSTFARLLDRWREMSPRRRLIPVLAVAVAALVVATTVVAITHSSGGSAGNASQVVALGKAPGGSQVHAEKGAPPNAARPSHEPFKPAGGGSGETVYEPELPTLAEGPKAKGNSSTKAAEEAEAGAATGGEPIPFSENARKIERSAYIVLGTKPGQVSGAAAKVYEAVHAVDGVVLHSSVHSGHAGATGASFSLLIPSAKLGDALAAFSSIAEVRERHDATNDITEPTVKATEELRDSNATIEGLLKELGNVETEAERESVEKQLREERRQHAAIRASLDNLHKRASMSEVSVRIVTGSGSGVVPAGKGSDSGWSIGDALHDAGRILTIAAGVLLIALAVLAPIALIAMLVWLAARFRLRRLRERALG